MKAITVRGIPPEVERVIRNRSSESGKSLNRVVLDLLAEGAGARKKRKKALNHDLDILFRAWSSAESQAFERALDEQRAIDPDLWR